MTIDPTTGLVMLDAGSVLLQGYDDTHSTATISDVDDEINGATGYANGDKFKDADDVRRYFTVENILHMFGNPNTMYGETRPTQDQLDGWAEWVIEHRSHMIPVVSLAEVEAEIVDAMTKADNAGSHWWAVRVGTDGKPYTSEEASPCYSESEYYRRSPHTVTVWTHTSNSSSTPGDGARYWDDCDESEAEFYSTENTPLGGVYGKEWCRPEERTEFPHCTVPKKLGDWVDLDLTDVMSEVRAELESCNWLEVTE